MTIGAQKDVVYTKGQNLFVDGKKQEKENFTLNYVSQCNFPPEDCQALKMKKYIETLPNGVRYNVLDITPTGGLDNTSAVTVPEGHYFAMGDNRDMSSDSRVFGFIPAENLIGRAEFIFFSTNHYLPMLGLLFPWEWFHQIRFERFFNGV
ncbi:MAG: signal peptidase I [Alphaproteobacteria bacterium]|nr:signal peptidase I [Alphaproteobacteria bacterium]